MKNNPKKLILFLIVLLSIVFIVIAMILFYLKSSINNQDIVKEHGGNILDGYASTENISRSAYFDINTCMTQYINVLNTKSSNYYGYDDNGKYNLIVEQEKIKENIYNVLSEVYKKDNNITIENIYDNIKTFDTQTLYVPLEAKVLQNGDIQSFIVHGLVETIELEFVDEIFVVVNIDKAKHIFSVAPINGKYNSISEIKIENLDDKINSADINIFGAVSVNNETIVKDYINIYKRLALGKPEILYNMLNEQYRKIRFPTLENFKEYINESKANIKKIRVEQYKTVKGKESTQYICADQNDNYYIFEESDILNYRVILDNYTIATDDYKESYNSSTIPEKVVLNIKRFFMGIDDKNYGYSYSVLSESFKNNNFVNLEAFIEYAKNNFFEKNKIQRISYKEESGVYIYKLKITDATGKNKREKEFNMIVQLNNGTDFEMSFGE